MPGQVYSKQEEKSGIWTWTMKTLRNSVRSLREVNDIVTFRTKEPIARLVEFGYDINFFLQEDDQIVSSKIAEKAFLYRTLQ